MEDKVWCSGQIKPRGTSRKMTFITGFPLDQLKILQPEPY